QVGIETGLQRAVAVCRRAVTGDRDEVNTLSSGLGADRPADLAAVDVGKPDVDKRDVRWVRSRLFDGVSTVARDRHTMPLQLEHHAQRFRGVRVVLDDQDRSRDDRRRLGGGRRELLAVVERETDHEFASLSDPRTGRGDGPTMLDDEIADHRESEPKARMRLAGVAGTSGENIEDPREELGRDARTGVADTQHRVAAFGADRELDPSGGVYLIALSRRLAIACMSRSASPRTTTGCGSVRSLTAAPTVLPAVRISSSESWASARRSSRRCRSISRPKRTPDTSRRS